MLICHAQALKSGQLPADLKIPDDDMGINSVHPKDDKMGVENQNESNEEQQAEDQQNNNRPVPIEEVCIGHAIL